MALWNSWCFFVFCSYFLFSFLSPKTIFSSASLCQQSSWNRKSSVVRSPCRNLIISEPNARISFKYMWLLLEAGVFFYYFLFFFLYLFFRISYIFRFRYHGPYEGKILKRYSSHKSQPKVFKLFLDFLPKGRHKITFGIFEILKIEILTIFVFVFVKLHRTWNPVVAKNFKALLLLQIEDENFQTFPEFSSQSSS